MNICMSKMYLRLTFRWIVQNVLRCLLNLVKVHIMLCTFKNGTIKSLILILSMFKRFFFIFIWHGIKNCNAEILLGVASNAAEILHGVACNAAEILQGTTLNAAEILQSLTAQACKYSAEILHGMASNDAEILQGLTSSAAEILHALTLVLQKFCKVWRPVLQKFCTPWRPVLQKLCTVWRPQQHKFCKQWHPELKKFYVLQGQCCRNSELLLFHSQKRQIVEGPRIPTVSISFLFMLFLFFSDHSSNSNTVYADIFLMIG